MRLEKTIRCVMQEPWLIQASYHANIRRLVDMKLRMSPAEFAAQKREGEDVSGGKVELPSMQVVDGVAYIPFAGVLLKGATGFEKGSGALAHEDVEADVNEAIESDEVQAIFFDCDSPGGTAAGSFELADLIAAASEVKPTMAWIERLCCSGALLSLSGCTMIYGSKSSEVGAVETYMAWLDASAALEKEGLKVELVKNTGGTHVAAGMPGHPLNKEQRAQLQAQVDQLYGMYVTHLESVRPQIDRESMDGRTFIGSKAVEYGFMDAVTTKAKAIADLRTWAKI